jgi:hypothetical protein
LGTPNGNPHFERGNNRYLAFVFACPGWFEQFHERPAAGDTGQNLHRLLQILRDWRVPGIPTREHLTITNAYAGVMYSEQDGDTQPSKRQIEQTENLARLNEELAHITGWVVFCGEKAHLAASLLEREPQATSGYNTAKIRHLSMKSLNQVDEDLFGLPINEYIIENSWHRSRARLDVVVKTLLDQMNLSHHVPTAQSLGQDITLIRRAWGEVVLVGPATPSQEQINHLEQTAEAMALTPLRWVYLSDRTLWIFGT